MSVLESTTYRLDIAYRGTAYNGFQSQPDGRAVQDQIEKALQTCLRQTVRVRGASRTDSGVHAEGQVAIFKSATALDIQQCIYSLNAIMPKDISVRDMSVVSPTFDPINSAQGKAYRYHLWLAKSQHPFFRDYVWSVRGHLDVELIRGVTQLLVGRHNFTSFCNKDSDAKEKVRTIYEIVMEERGPLLSFWFVGDGFLKQMIRIIIGTYVDVGLGRIHPRDIVPILQAQDRRLAGQTAPASGLSLVEIFYGQIPSVAELIDKAGGGYCVRV
jgi:tRNA pseudouridine38-40 synthase